MQDNIATILAVLDRCCGASTFPALDNGYWHLAATRLALFRSEEDWAMTIEVFGFNPRAGLPDVSVFTFASRLHERDPPSNYVNRTAYENYIAHNPHNDVRFFHPIDDGDWLDGDFVSASAGEVVLRGSALELPSRAEYELRGVELEAPDAVAVIELCRYLAAVERDLVLATPAEQRVSIRPDMDRILQLEKWNHPDVVRRALPSRTESFQQLARVLVTGDVSQYRPTSPMDPSQGPRHGSRNLCDRSRSVRDRQKGISDRQKGVQNRYERCHLSLEGVRDPSKNVIECSKNVVNRSKSVSNRSKKPLFRR
jgi:hypothetical protein